MCVWNPEKTPDAALCGERVGAWGGWARGSGLGPQDQSMRAV